jgi:hypothetical protein
VLALVEQAGGGTEALVSLLTHAKYLKPCLQKRVIKNYDYIAAFNFPFYYFRDKTLKLAYSCCLFIT